MQTTRAKSGIYGYGVYGSLHYGEDYAPLSVTESESFSITETVSSEISSLHSDTLVMGETGTAELSTGDTYKDYFSVSESVSCEISLTETESVPMSETAPAEPSGLSTDSFVVTESYTTEYGITVVDVFSYSEWSGEVRYYKCVVMDTELTYPKTKNISSALDYPKLEGMESTLDYPKIEYVPSHLDKNLEKEVTMDKDTSRTMKMRCSRSF